MTNSRQTLGRKLKFAWVVLNKFKLSLACILLVLVGGGLLIAYEKNLPIGEGILTAWAALFFEFLLLPPYPWGIQVFFYIAPLLGIFVIADSVTAIFHMLFGKRSQLQEWWIMTASTYQNHVIVCGVGKVGYRVINELVKMGELVVGIEEETNQMFVQELIDRNIPIIVGNIRVKSVLEKANVRTAKSVLCVTSDDLTNLDCAFTVREIKPDVHVVVRIFDDTIARKISSQFHLPAISTSHAAAPVFVAQALGHEAPQLNSIMVFGQQLGVSNMEVAADADGKTIANLETALRLKVVGGANKGGESIMPLPDYVVKSGDKLMVVALQR